MNRDISMRLVHCQEKLKQAGIIPSARQFCLSLDFAPQSYSSIIKGKREVTIELIKKAVQVYNVNAQYIFTGVGNPLDVCEESERILTVVTDRGGNEKIIHVPYGAEAGYVDQIHDELFVDELPIYSLPGPSFAQGSFRSFDVKGDSMEPILSSGDRVVCSYIQKEWWYSSLKDNEIYVLVTTDGIVVKRIVSNLNADHTIKCHSDNQVYDSFDIHLSDLVEIWKVKTRMTEQLYPKDDHASEFTAQLELLKDFIENQSNQINDLKKTIDLLLKTNRVGR